jgi:hypothetical protein
MQRAVPVQHQRTASAGAVAGAEWNEQRGDPAKSSQRTTMEYQPLNNIRHRQD